MVKKKLIDTQWDDYIASLKQKEILFHTKVITIGDQNRNRGKNGFCNTSQSMWIWVQIWTQSQEIPIALDCWKW